MKRRELEQRRDGEVSPARAVGRLVVPAFAALVLLCPGAGRLPAAEPAGLYDSETSPTRALPAEEAAARWRWPDGLRATVFAAEPDVRQPIAMAFDDRGRLWVAECDTFAEVKRGFDPALKDRILIFADRDGDGRFDERTVFAEGLARLSSLEVGFGGVWALASPHLLFFPDRDGDDRADGPAEVRLDGFNWQQAHHNFANGLRWGPDGWLYGRHGVQGVSALGQPGAPASARVRTNGGIWRYHPTRQVVEVVCHGTTNPWGLDWNEVGEAFFINTVIGHLWHAIPGAYFRRMHGQPLNPFAYELIDQHADHQHWATAESWHSWKRVGTTSATSAAGGGHAHTGLMFYGGDNWPAAWRGKLLTINYNGRRLNVESVTRRGSGYVGRHEPDIGFAADPWFRGIDLGYGADGGVYVLDWSDTGECHEHDGVHRRSGRIYKVTHRDAPHRPPPEGLATMAAAELPPLLAHANEFFSRQVRRRLQELAATGMELTGVHVTLRGLFAGERNVVLRLRALWALHAAGGAGREFLRTCLGDPEEHVRVWAVRLLTDNIEEIAADAATIGAFTKLAGEESSAMVRLALASALQRLPVAARTGPARGILSRTADAADHNLPAMVWWGIEPLAETAPESLAELGAAFAWPLVRRSVARRLSEGGAHTADGLRRLLGATAAAQADDVLRGMLAARRDERRASAPAGWAEAAAAWTAEGDAGVRDQVRALGVVFGEPAALAATRELVLDRAAALERRRAALRALLDRRADGLTELCLAVVADPGLAAVAAEGLSVDPDPLLADRILEHLPALAESDREAVLGGLISRAEWAARVLDAVARGALPRDSLSAYHLRQIRALNDGALSRQLDAVLGVEPPRRADKPAQIVHYRALLSSEFLQRANVERGRELYLAVCGSCHVLNGEGRALGPELTGSSRDNVEYLLHNIIDPSAAVPGEFRLASIHLKDGRVLGGFIRGRSDRGIVLNTLAETLTIPAAEILRTEQSTQSIMPEGLLDHLTDAEVRDLVAYLMR